QPRVLGVQLTAQRRQTGGGIAAALRRGDVARVQTHAAEALGGSAQHPFGRFGADESWQQAAQRSLLDRERPPLTAPAVRPPVTRPCTSRKKTTTGRLVRVAPAMSPPQSVPCWAVKDASQIVSVCLDELLKRT